jgi:nucleoside-diphosphate-sugar epimerase
MDMGIWDFKLFTRDHHMARIVVTGGAGFIGSHLSIRLRSLGHEVVIFDSMGSGISPLLAQGDNGLISGDILDMERLSGAMKDAEFVFHNAAMRSIPLSMKEPLGTSRVNIMGTLNVLEAARKGAAKVILASSSSVYGSVRTPLREDMPMDSRSFYALSKEVNERHAKLYHELYGMDVICLRYFNVFGPAQDSKGDYSPVIPKFIDALISGKRPVIFGDGSQKRDFTFIDNVVHANVLAINAGKEASGRAFNVGQGEMHSLNEILGLINGFLGTKIEPVYEKPRAGDVRDSLADLALSGKMLGYRPAVTFRDGLERTVDWFKHKKLG